MWSPAALLLVIVASPALSQDKTEGPIVCAGKLKEQCTTGFCFDSINIHTSQIESGCGTTNECPSTGCNMIGNKFVCCCTKNACNGKSAGLIRARLRQYHAAKNEEDAQPAGARLNPREVTPVEVTMKPSSAEITTPLNTVAPTAREVPTPPSRPPAPPVAQPTQRTEPPLTQPPPPPTTTLPPPPPPPPTLPPTAPVPQYSPSTEEPTTPEKEEEPAATESTTVPTTTTPSTTPVPETRPTAPAPSVPVTTTTERTTPETTTTTTTTTTEKEVTSSSTTRQPDEVTPLPTVLPHPRSPVQRIETTQAGATTASPVNETSVGESEAMEDAFLPCWLLIALAIFAGVLILALIVLIVVRRRKSYKPSATSRSSKKEIELQAKEPLVKNGTNGTSTANGANGSSAAGHT